MRVEQIFGGVCVADGFRVRDLIVGVDDDGRLARLEPKRDAVPGVRLEEVEPV